MNKFLYQFIDNFPMWEKYQPTIEFFFKVVMFSDQPDNEFSCSIAI